MALRHTSRDLGSYKGSLGFLQGVYKRSRSLGLLKGFYSRV